MDQSFNPEIPRPKTPENAPAVVNPRQQNRLIAFALAAHEKDAKKFEELMNNREYSPTLEERILFWDGIRAGTVTERELRWFPEGVTNGPSAGTSKQKESSFKNALECFTGINPKNKTEWGIARKKALIHFTQKQVQYAEQFFLLKAQIETVIKMEKHIKEGLGLIRSGLYEEAEKHFSSHTKAAEVGSHVEGGEVQIVRSLLTRGELYDVLYSVAAKSRPDELPAYWQKNFLSTKEMEDQPELYDPELLKEFRYEVALLFAEEWLHKLQRRMEAPVAGEQDAETDIAAYLDKEGLRLSDHFISRYAGRGAWFTKKHPERKKSLREFYMELKKLKEAS